MTHITALLVAAVAQLVELSVVVRVVAGSNPVGRPILPSCNPDIAADIQVGRRRRIRVRKV